MESSQRPNTAAMISSVNRKFLFPGTSTPLIGNDRHGDEIF